MAFQDKTNYQSIGLFHWVSFQTEEAILITLQFSFFFIFQREFFFFKMTAKYFLSPMSKARLELCFKDGIVTVNFHHDLGEKNVKTFQFARLQRRAELQTGEARVKTKNQQKIVTNVKSEAEKATTDTEKAILEDKEAKNASEKAKQSAEEAKTKFVKTKINFEENRSI